MDHATDDGTVRAHVGLICNPDHDVFGVVADRLRRRGLRVTVFAPGRELTEPELAELDLLMNKKVAPASVRALAAAERRGLATWNGYWTVLLGARFVGYSALERAGARVPPAATDPPEGEYVAKSPVDWHTAPDPERNGEGTVYQELVAAEPVDYKYYAVDTGRETVVRVLRTTSKLHGEKRPLGMVEPAPGPAATVRRLLALTDTQAIGVDFLRAEGEWYAVDVNPAMSFRNAGMETELVASVLARLPATAAQPLVDA